MKKTNIFYGNQHIDSMYCGKTRFQVFKNKAVTLLKRTLLVSAVFSLMGWSVYAGSAYIPRTVYAEKEVVKEVPVDAPVMDRIAMCESSNSHRDKTGQVLMHSNKDGTVDVGKYQINSVWYKKATQMGLDLTNEQDNKTMAYWIYQNRGTGDWLYSAKCWNK